jgi:organic hydroperoxide reductase OsmC/OhrA
MNISARISNQQGQHGVEIETDGRKQSLTIVPKPEGFGSSANGGELLFLALATCYCNDIYREAGKRGIEVQKVKVEVTGEFGGPGEAARNISYRASVDARASQREIIELMQYTDSVAEIQNTVRGGTQVVLVQCEAREV